MHFSMRWRGRGVVNDLVKNLDGSVAEYSEIYAQHSGNDLSKARILEIGFGARPLRLFWLTSLGFNVTGIDLDRPVLRGSFSEFRDMLRKNGAQRVLKSAVRHFLFDRSEWKALDAVLKGRGLGGLKIEEQRFIIGDASSVDFRDLAPAGFDFVYSEDVFEHVPKDALENLIKNLSRALAPGGCALFSPHVYSSISGGHLTEWYPHIALARSAGDTSCRSEPWEHLRKCRFKANTYLNKLRLADYREMLGRHFEIVSEIHTNTGVGVKFLTDEIRAELSDYTEEELLVDNVRFVCRRHLQ